MSIIREKHILNDRDINLPIFLVSKQEIVGDYQEINEYTQKTAKENINKPNDKELKRFKYGDSLKELFFVMKYYDVSDETYGPSLENLGFTKTEIRTYASNLRNSFFILDYFSDYKSNKRKKIISKYFTKISYVENNESEYYSFTNNNQLKYIDIPISHINTIEEDIFDVYLRVMFYNGKTGNIHLFYNEAKNDINNENKLFFKFTLNLNNFIWSIDSNELTNPFGILGKEMINNQNYLDRINKTNKNISDLSPNYSKGTLFDYLNGRYRDHDET